MMLCSKEKCTGCHACYNVCPKNAIDMIEDEYGYIYPKINKDKCINCGLCCKVCYYNKEMVASKPYKCYAMQALDKNIHKTSTSGGAATVISKYIIENGGVVYGAAYNHDLSLHHIRIDKIDELVKLQGSKYVHSYIIDNYKKVLKDLKDNLIVLFIGTPCQVDGLRNYLRKDYMNLLTIDLICHGVPSQKFLKDEICLHVDINDVNNISFRNEEGKNFKLLDISNKNLYSKSDNANYYYIGFMNGLLLRENCFNCPYSKPERVSDLTIGDFWGLGREKEFKGSKKDGISVILINSQKGEEVIDKCKDLMFLEERDINEAINGNYNLRKPSIKNKNRELFLSTYLTKGYQKAIEKSLILLLFKEKLNIFLKKIK